MNNLEVVCNSKSTPYISRYHGALEKTPNRQSDYVDPYHLVISLLRNLHARQKIQRHEMQSEMFEFFRRYSSWYCLYGALWRLQVNE